MGNINKIVSWMQRGRPVSKQSARDPSGGSNTRPNKCRFNDGACDRYFKVMNASVQRVKKAKTIVGVDDLTYLNTSAEASSVATLTHIPIYRVLIMAETSTKFGPIVNLKHVQGPRNTFRRPKQWRQPRSKAEATTLHLLQAATMSASRQQTCLDVFMQLPRLKEDGKADTYKIKDNWRGDTTRSNLAQTQVELEGCVSRFDDRVGPRSHCPLGCLNVRVHDIDPRPQVGVPKTQSFMHDITHREQMAKFMTPALWEGREQWLQFFTTSELYWNDDTDMETSMWKQYRESVFRGGDDFADYEKYRYDWRGRSRQLLAQREDKLMQSSTSNSKQDAVQEVRDVVISVYISFLEQIYQINHQLGSSEHYISWYMITSVQMLYYMVLRLVTRHTVDYNSPCQEAYAAQSAILQIDSFFKAPIIEMLLLLWKGRDAVLPPMHIPFGGEEYTYTSSKSWKESKRSDRQKVSTWFGKLGGANRELRPSVDEVQVFNDKPLNATTLSFDQAINALTAATPRSKHMTLDRSAYVIAAGGDGDMDFTFSSP